jgi:hypothetical protein
VDIPHEEEVHNNKKDFNYFKEEGFEIQDLEAEVLETTLEEDGDNKHIFTIRGRGGGYNNHEKRNI